MKTATIDTNRGKIKLKLHDDKTPKTVENFEKLAKEHSQDPGTAEKGGDLGFFSRNMMVKSFEDTVFQMKLIFEFQSIQVVQLQYNLAQTLKFSLILQSFLHIQ